MHTNENTELNSKNEYKLQVMLAEYNALTSENRDRMKIQHNLLQIHITVLTAIIGVAFSQSSTMLFLLIPIESSIFGIWYFDIAITMLEIGKYIRDKIETKIQTDFNDKCIMGWGSHFNGDKKNNLKVNTVFNPSYRHIISLGIVAVTFIIPTIIPLFHYSYLWRQGNSIVENNITKLLITGDFILVFIFIFVIFYYIRTSSKVGKEYKNEKYAVTNEIQQS